MLAPAKTHDTRYDDVWTPVPGRVRHALPNHLLPSLAAGDLDGIAEQNVVEVAVGEGLARRRRETALRRRGEGAVDLGAGYDVVEGKLRLVDYHDHAAYAAGGLHSTLDDLRRWHDAYWSDKILSRPSLALATTPVRENYGYGWQVVRHFGHPLHNHTGGLTGFASHLAYYPDDDLLIVVLSNIESENAKATACDLAALVFAVKPEPVGDRAWVERSKIERCQPS